MKIYLKLYFWFLLVFIVTLTTVLILAARFYGASIHEEIERQITSHGAFLQSEYRDACVPDFSSKECRRLLHRIEHLPMVRFWILDGDGHMRRPPAVGPPPESLSPHEIKEALTGNTVTSFGRRGRARAILPVSRGDGKNDFLVLERLPLPRHRFPGFPLLTALLITGGMIAILVLPLSLRLTRPLRELHQLGSEWSEGNLEKRSRTSGTDEIAGLASVYNNMAANLQRMLQQRQEFLALISHELKSPLARMRIALELLSERGSSPEERKQLVQSLEAEVAESEKLIEQLLIVSRIEMSAADLSIVDAFALVERTIRQIQPLAGSKNIQVRLSGDHCTIRGDELQLQRAVGNVLENAVKFSSSERKVDVQIHAQNRMVKIQCSDSGAGIDNEDREKLFEPFYRGKSAQGKEGAGLGLFIARRIIELHHGTISVMPNKPSGVTITIQIPTAEKL